MKQKIIIENIVKNVLVAVALIISLVSIRDFLSKLQPADYSMIGIISSLLIMAFLFADYAFTYTASNLQNPSERMLDHSLTTLIMYGTGVLLEIAVLSLDMAIGRNFFFLEFIAVLFYISLVMYDFWDLNRALKNYR